MIITTTYLRFSAWSALALGLAGTGLLAAYHAGKEAGEIEQHDLVEEALRTARTCFKDFDDVGQVVIQCARLVGVKPDGNKRRELPTAVDVAEAAWSMQHSTPRGEKWPK